MSHYKSYPEYKYSGVEWLGHVPEHWEVSPMKWAIERNDGGVWGDDPIGESDTLVLRSTEQTVDGNWRIEEPAYRALSAADKEFALLKAGDLLVTKSSGSALHIGKTTLVTPEIEEMQCCYSNFMQRIRTTDDIRPKLAWYLMNNGLVREQFDYLSNTTTGLANLNGTMIGSVHIAIPPDEEQKAILAALDRETARIDSLVEKKTRFIELLREKRQALITHAVTKGLDPNVKMKDSGVEWLEEVPAHWRVSPLRWWARCASGDFINNTDVSPMPAEGQVIPVIGGNGVAGFCSMSNLEKTNLIIGRVGALCGNVHRINPPAWVTDNALILTIDTRKIDLGFLRFVLDARNLNSIAAKTAQPLITGSLVAGQFIPIPSLDEQKNICKYIEGACARLDNLSEKTERSIELLKERRSALITAAVTGQIDLREAA